MFLLRVKFIKQGEKRETSTKPCKETVLLDKLRVFVSRILPPVVSLVLAGLMNQILHCDWLGLPTFP